jgi:hypothetical protein
MKFQHLPSDAVRAHGCARHQGDLPPVSGEPEPVNSPAIIQELTHHV